MKKRLYISIPITGVEEKSKIKAEQLQKHFEAQGYEVISPFEIGFHLEKLHELCGHKPPTWGNYMDWCIWALRSCDVVCFCVGWACSKGCTVEMEEAIKFKKEIRYE